MKIKYPPKADCLCLGICAAYTATAFTVSLLRYLSLGANMYDLGMFDQSLWNAAHGMGFFSPLLGKSLLQHHWMPILSLLVPPYFSGLGGPWWLLFIQSAAVGASAFFLYHIIISRHFHQNPTPAVAIAAGYLFAPGTQNALFFDFHPSTFLPLFELAILYGVLNKSRAMIIISAALALMVKEHAGLSVMGIGVLSCFLGKETRKSGLILIIVGLGFFIMINGLGKLMGFAQDTLDRYGWLGGNVYEMALTILTHPVQVIGHVLKDHDAFHYLFALFIPALGLCLLAPRWLIPALPLMTLNLLAEFDLGRMFKYHYQIEIMPWIFLAAAAGAVNMSRFCRTMIAQKHLTLFIAIMIFASSLVCARMNGRMLPIFNDYSRNRIEKKHRKITKKLRKYIAENVNAETSIAASGSIVFPVVTHRRQYAMVPVRDNFKGYDLVIFDRGRPHWDPAQDLLTHEQFDRIQADPQFELDKDFSDRIYVFRRIP